jgi:hypothetical protein
MGHSKWSDDAYSHLSNSRKGAKVNDIFTNNSKGKASEVMMPTGIKFRESRDSDAHPESLAISVFLDVTGSMGRIPEILVREKLGSLMNTLIEQGILHPQILFGAIGDHISDRFPLQTGQFESGTAELDKSLTEIYIEGGGGGQHMESYTLAWLFCGRHTSIDCFEKRGQKGFLFTIGDEAAWDTLQSAALKKIMGYAEASDVSDTQLLAEAQRMYHVYHIHINEASYRDNPTILGYWRKLLGEKLIILNNYRALAETIAATVAVMNGVDVKNLLSSFDSATADSVKKALVDVTKNAAAVAPTDKKNFISKIFKL